MVEHAMFAVPELVEGVAGTRVFCKCKTASLFPAHADVG